MKARVLVFTALLVGCLAGTAQATTTAAKNAPYEVVSYADLNIANEADATILLQRVKAAAHRVCIRSGALLALDFHNSVQRCANDATARAMTDVVVVVSVFARSATAPSLVNRCASELVDLSDAAHCLLEG